MHEGFHRATRPTTPSSRDGGSAPRRVSDGVGGPTLSDLFLEVHHYVRPAQPADEPSITLPAGDVAREIIIPRCEMEFTGSDGVRVEMRLRAAGYEILVDQPIRPVLDPALFPRVL